jgi:hypothetical protein
MVHYNPCASISLNRFGFNVPHRDVHNPPVCADFRLITSEASINGSSKSGTLQATKGYRRTGSSPRETSSTCCAMKFKSFLAHDCGEVVAIRALLPSQPMAQFWGWRLVVDPRLLRKIKKLVQILRCSIVYSVEASSERTYSNAYSTVGLVRKTKPLLPLHPTDGLPRRLKKIYSTLFL